MPTVRLAKFSAAHKACKLLYEYGELSENLMPMNAYRCLSSVSDTYFRHWNEPVKGMFNFNVSHKWFILFL